jgi:hypothetical protein
MGQRFIAGFLVVVRGKPMVLGADKGVEKCPGLACDSTEKNCLPSGEAGLASGRSRELSRATARSAALNSVISNVALMFTSKNPLPFQFVASLPGEPQNVILQAKRNTGFKRLVKHRP